MNILIDIGHPAHVHVFKNFAREMKDRGHQVLFTAKEKECTIQLLKAYDLEYVTLGTPFSGAAKKVYGLLHFGRKLYKVARGFKADLFLSISSMYAAHVSTLMGKPHLVLDDTEHSAFEHMLYKPFSEYIITPSCFEKNMGSKQIRYDGYHELAYLHPSRFEFDPSIYEELGVEAHEPFALLRFVSWNAGHDIQQAGLTLADKMELVRELKQHGKVFISSEKDLPADLEADRVTIAPERMHHLLKAATLYVGEGASMASECAMLGTPSIYVNSLDAGTLKEQEAYGLIYSFRSYEGVLGLAKSLMSDTEVQDRIKESCALMLKDKIDVTSMLTRMTSEILREGAPQHSVITRFTPIHT